MYSLIILLLSVIVKTKKIAIIGCGAGGSAAAYYLKDFDVTVFEKSNICGGRVEHI